MALITVRDQNSGKIVAEFSDSDSCSGSGNGATSEMCGGCGSCLRMQAEYSGFNVTEESEMKRYEVFRHVDGKPVGDPVGTVIAENLGAAQVLARQVYPCERGEWLDVFTLWERTGPSREYLQRMADAEDAAGSTSVGGMAVDMGQPVVAGAEKFRTQAEQDAADLTYLRELDRLRQEAGITAAMLRDGRAKDAIARLAQIAGLLETAVCTVDPDKGVVLLSQEGTTHPETYGDRTIQVYDNQYFSPLGEALIAAWELAKGNVR